jgi:ABC-2 type transport system permease protein
MSVVTTIARKEWTEMLRDDRFRAAAVTILLLLVAALASGFKQQRAIAVERADAARHARSIWVGQTPKDPHAAAHFGTFAFKPRTPLALVDQGLDPYIGISIYLVAHQMNQARYLPAQDRTTLERFGELTAAVVLQVMMPLVIVLLTFAAFAGEREQGTLRQIVSIGVKPSEFVLGKMLGVGAALSALTLPAAFLGALAIWFAQDSLSSNGAARFVTLVLVYAAYFTSVVCAAMAVSIRAASSRLALIVLIAAWVWNGLLAPRIFSDVARSLYPTPTAAEFADQLYNDVVKGIDGHSRQTRDQLAASLMKQYGVDKVSQLPVNLQGIALQQGEESSNHVWDKHYTALWGQYDRQARFVAWGGLLAPLTAVRSLSMSLAGTDFAHHRDFAWAAERYRRQMVKTLNTDLAYHSRTGQAYTANRALWESIPDFTYQPPSMGWALSQQTPAIVVIAVWIALGAAVLGICACRARIV